MLVLASAAAACDGDSDDASDAVTVAPPQAPTSQPPASQASAATATVAPTTVASATAVAVTPTGTPLPAGAARASAAATQALRAWLGPAGDPASLTVRSVEEKTWSNGCLELNRAGQACIQVLVPGYRIVFGLGSATYEVRSDLSGENLRWAPQVMILVQFKEASANVVEFSTDDGGPIVTQAVFGTDFGVEVASLQPGDPVGIAIVDAPQGGNPLLVWLDPFS